MSRNSSEIIRGITTKVNIVIGSFLTPVLTLSSSAVILIAILLALVAVDPLMSLIAFVGFGMIYRVVFDEATNALDNKTERAVMDAIDHLGSGLTVLNIAHRLSTLQRCDLIVELQQGRISRIGSYAEIVSDR
ncbi:MAG: hypothetical protein WBF69_03005 [Castellaniella sp.]|uniref:hypothetical protein n=1 Tax=Castellaniella sp. TaxID=1955812 RepID=UPI003C722042